jgi:hypothetical protein
VIPRGPELPSSEHELYRQVPGPYVDGERLTWQAFSPPPKDEGMLSTSDGERVSAEEAFKFATGAKGLSSRGTWAVTRAECHQVKVKCWSDPEPGPPPDDAHALIDFTVLPTKSQVMKAAKLLVAKADARGVRYPPADQAAA